MTSDDLASRLNQQVWCRTRMCGKQEVEYPLARRVEAQVRHHAHTRLRQRIWQWIDERLGFHLRPRIFHHARQH